MTPRPFWFRLLLPFVLLAVLLAAASFGVSFWAAEGTVYLDQVRTLDAATEIVRANDSVDRLRDLAKQADVRITVVRGDGSVQFDTDADPATMENHNNRPEIIAARANRLASAAHQSKTLHQRATYIARTVDPSQPGGLVVRTCYRDARFASLRTPLWVVSAGGLAATVLMVTGLAMVLQRQWVRPTRDLTGAAVRMAAGQWNARVDPHGAGDVKFLAEKMNQVATEAENQLAEITKQRRDLRSLVDALPDPILVTDSKGHVILLNVPAADLLELSPDRVVGQGVVNVINDDVLLKLLAAAGTTIASWKVPPTMREVRLVRGGHKRTFQSVTTRTATGGALLVLRDVTAMADTVQMKTDFVANASHELRTPIAAIKIAMETMREVYGDDPDQTDRCVNIIEGHIKRLEDLLQDLLDLSRLESPEAKPTWTQVKTWDLFAVSRSTMEPTAREKGVDLHFDDMPVESFRSDERLLNLVLKNLVENSVKFTPPGGSITVSAQSVEADGRPAVKLSVADTGVGIPPEHRDRVFERFYQVDPARSGTAGRGTGLGLAIVKHAVAALNGSVKLESTVGVGTTVTCMLPQDVATIAED